MAGIGKVDLHVGDDARRPRPEDDDALAEQQRFLDVVCDEQRREPGATPEADELFLHGEARQGIELAERLVEQQQPRIVHERPWPATALRHAAGELVRIGRGEAVEPDEPDDLVDAPAARSFAGALRLGPSATLPRTVRQG